MGEARRKKLAKQAGHKKAHIMTRRERFVYLLRFASPCMSRNMINRYADIRKL